MHPYRRRLIGALATLLSLAAVVLPGPAALAQPPWAPITAISWSDCGSGFQCANMQVPLDYSKPDGQTIALAISRLPARNSSQRIGSLLVNPGGPGASAIDFMRIWARIVSPDIRNRFDIVAFDPRGVGESTPIDCHATLQQFVAVDPSPDNAQEWAEAEEAAKTFVQGCTSKYNDILPYLGTKNVARDMETIRQALGEDKLTYLGYSYGTAIGAVYADMYPNRVRAFVLDGAVDLSLSFEEVNKTQMVGFERAYQAYLADCKAKSCAIARNGDPGAAVDKLLAQVEVKPIPAPGADRPAGPGETLLGIISAMYSKQQWPMLTAALQNAMNGNGSGLVQLADQYLERNPDGSYPNLMEANMAVNYDDETCPKDPQAYIDLATEFARAAPHFGASAATSGLTCAYWPYKPDPLSAPKAAGAPPIVVISTTNDPATPYEWGLAMSKQLESGRLIIHRGEGHTIYAQGDSCVDQAVNDYLINLQAPAQGKTCGTGAPPPESAATPGSAATNTPAAANETATAPNATATHAPGPPSTGGGKDGSGHVLVIVLILVGAAIVVGAGVVIAQRR